MIHKYTVEAAPDWGINFPRPTASGSGLELVTAPIPEQLIVTLDQHIGAPAIPMVEVGACVLKGQPIAATPRSQLGAHIHAPTSGQITAIRKIDLPERRASEAITIRKDDLDTPWEGYQPNEHPLELPPVIIREAIIDAGIVGLGGAMFPAGVKLNPGSGINTLILNGVECEPQINCDDALMRHEPMQILLGRANYASRSRSGPMFGCNKIYCERS